MTYAKSIMRLNNAHACGTIIVTLPIQAVTNANTGRHYRQYKPSLCMQCMRHYGMTPPSHNLNITVTGNNPYTQQITWLHMDTQEQKKKDQIHYTKLVTTINKTDMMISQ